MSNDGALDQNEIERLLNGMSGGAAPPPSPAAEPASDPAPTSGSSGILDQSELDALFAAGPTASASAPSIPEPPADSPSSSGPLSQAELDALLSGVSEKPAAASEKSPPKPATPQAAPVAAPPTPEPQRFPPVRTPVFSPSASNVSTPPIPDYGSSEEDEDGVLRGDIDYLLKHADNTLRSVAAAPLDLPLEVIEFQYPEFGGTVPGTEHATLDQISEVELDVKIELGRTNMYLEDILKLRKGSVVSLDKMAGEAVDIYINGRLLARGEVLVMNENFCVRVAELLAGAIPME